MLDGISPQLSFKTFSKGAFHKLSSKTQITLENKRRLFYECGIEASSSPFTGNAQLGAERRRSGSGGHC